MKPGILRLQQWKHRFDPSTGKTSNVQTWIRFYRLPWEVEDPSILFGIVRQIGVPLCIDNMTLSGDLGQFARVLVDLDLSKLLQHTLTLDYEASLVPINIVHERLPGFCHSCKVIGHTIVDCRLLGKTNSKPDDKENGKSRPGPHRRPRHDPSPALVPQDRSNLANDCPSVLAPTPSPPIVEHHKHIAAEAYPPALHWVLFLHRHNL